MKYKITALLSIIMILIVFQPLSAMTKEVLFEVDGKEVSVPHAFIEKGRTLVPLAFFDDIAEKITVDNQVITIEDEYTSVTLTIDSEEVLIYHKYDLTGIPEKVIVDTMPKLVGDVNFIPLRIVAEALNIKVSWDGVENKVLLYTEEVYNQPIDFSIIDPKVTLMTEELSKWFYESVEVKGMEYKTMGDYTYIKVQAGEMPTGGYDLVINGLYDLGKGKVFVEGELITPNPSDMVIQVLTYPSALIQVNTSDLPFQDEHITLIGEIE